MLRRSINKGSLSRIHPNTVRCSPVRFSSNNLNKPNLDSSNNQQHNSHDTNNNQTNYNKWRLIAVAISGGAILLTAVYASDDHLETPSYPFNHKGHLQAFDTASLRRGFEVYRQVCSSCHSLDLLCYRNLVGVTHTEEQAKALAESITVKDGPDEKGEMFERPGRLTDKIKRPYPNDEFARYVNGGALPPDLSLMAKARHHGDDYIFSLLTGYREPPAGITLREGLHYNPYFPGGAIAMAKALNDGQMEYEDGTPATETQMAKDVTTFLTWCAEPAQDERKKTGFKLLSSLFVIAFIAGYYKRFRWSIVKTRKLYYKKNPFPQK